jgi:4,5-DOPA dioxygenase extradiol
MAAAMPVVYISHGTPMNALWDNPFTRAWAALGRVLPRPAAIVSVSAHWVTRSGTGVTSDARPRTIYDMRGFPDELYRVTYDAPGDPALAAELAERVSTSRVVPSAEWGFDHGTWSVLRHMSPRADIPVVQLSIDDGLSGAGHLVLGRELSYLRERGVLILGTGQFVHNLREASGIAPDDVAPYDWAVEFGDTIRASIEARDFEAVADFESLGPLAKRAHPTDEHFVPLLYALGASRDDDTLEWICEGIVNGCHDMRSLRIG